MSRFGAVELGGSKAFVAVGEDPLGLTSTRIATEGPSQTLRAIRVVLEGRLDGLGVGAFGPIGVTPGRPGYGLVGNTPKKDWSGTDLLAAFSSSDWPTPIIDTDVNAAALAEASLGAGIERDQVAYVTVGTGIGAGLIVDGDALRGHPHPELGHTVVVPREDDSFKGGCQYHPTCLEGMAAGPALAARFGGPVETLPDETMIEARDLACHYLAQGLRNLVYAWAPDRVVVGGGVSRLEGFHEALREGLVAELGDYPGGVEPDLVAAPGLGEWSGLVGAFLLGRGAR